MQACWDEPEASPWEDPEGARAGCEVRDARGAKRQGVAGIGRSLGLILGFLSSCDFIRLAFERPLCAENRHGKHDGDRDAAGRQQCLGPTPIAHVRVSGTGKTMGRIPAGVGYTGASDTWPKDAWLGGQSFQFNLNS